MRLPSRFQTASPMMGSRRLIPCRSRASTSPTGRATSTGTKCAGPASPSPTSRRPRAATIVDPKFLQNWNGAKNAGVVRGAYHFIYWCRPADEQALWFMLNVPHDPDALPPVLDVEWNSASKTCPHHVARDVALRRSRSCSTRCRRIPASSRSSTPTPYFIATCSTGSSPTITTGCARSPPSLATKYRSRSLGVLAVHHHGQGPRRCRPGRPQQLQRHRARLAARAEMARGEPLACRLLAGSIPANSGTRISPRCAPPKRAFHQ